MELRDCLEELTRTRGADFLANDPLGFVRRYDRAPDREIAAFFCAALAYGRVASIRSSLADLFARMGTGPREFVAGFDPRRDSPRFSGFRHRFNSGEDLAALCLLLKAMVERHGSVEGFFLEGDDGGEDVGGALASFCSRALQLDASAIFGPGGIPPRAGVRYFFPSPAGGSACKRLCMFLRWVCRPDDGIDLGLWRGVSPARLVIPLDTHTGRIARLLGWSRRGQADWKMALEVTGRLREFAPLDPVRYDFALAHLGISDGCQGRLGEKCLVCPVGAWCMVAKGRG